MNTPHRRTLTRAIRQIFNQYNAVPRPTLKYVGLILAMFCLLLPGKTPVIGTQVQTPKSHKRYWISVSILLNALLINQPSLAIGPFVEETGERNPLSEIEGKPTFLDMDSDNDFDLLIESYDGIKYFENTGNPFNPNFMERKNTDNPFHFFNENNFFFHKGQAQVFENDDPVLSKGYEHHSITPIDIDHDEDFDIFLVEEIFLEELKDMDVEFVVLEGRLDMLYHSPFKSRINYYENVGTNMIPIFVEHTGSKNPFDGILFERHSRPTFVDFNKDGNFNVFVSESSKNIQSYKITGITSELKLEKQIENNNPLNEMSGNDVAFVDIDKDGDFDVFASNSINDVNQIEYYQNFGDNQNPSFKKLSNTKNPLYGLDILNLPLFLDILVLPLFVDINSDGDFDFFLGNRFFRNAQSKFNKQEISIAMVSAGPFHTCTLKPDGSITCWGNNSKEQTTPPIGDNFSQVSVGEEHSCALKIDGSIICWGNGKDNSFLLPDAINDFTQISAGGENICALRMNGSIACWIQKAKTCTSPASENQTSENIVCSGENDFSQQIFPQGNDFTRISVSNDHACALKIDGHIMCWEKKIFASSQIIKNVYDEDILLNDNELVQIHDAIGIDISKFTSYQNYCVVKIDGSLVCWRKLSFPFFVTDNTLVERIETSGSSLLEPPIGNNFIQVSLGENYACAVKTDNSITCWGDNMLVTTPPDGNNFKQVSAGKEHACATKTNGGIVCWGDNQFGQTTLPNDLTQIPTTLSISLSRPTLLQKDSLNVTGKLQIWPKKDTGFVNQPIVLTVTSPDSEKTTYTTQTKDDGSYSFTNILGFTQKGIYTLQTAFAGTPNLLEFETINQSVRVGPAAGYAILIQGKVQGDERGALTYNKTLNRVYRKLKLMGFTDDNIRYFNYNTEQDIDGDNQNDAIFDVHRKMDIKTAIEAWARDRINGSPAPLYLVMVDHGDQETFYIHHDNDDKNDDVISLNELNQWLNTLESGLNETALQEPRVIIIGACRSGSFIHARSPSETLSKTGRIIITSADKDESSARGVMKEKDNILTGELFIEQLFDGLVYGDPELNDGVPLDFKAAFEQAILYIEQFTNNPVTLRNRFNDNAVQHPLLDDDGDGQGNNVLSSNKDGQQVDSLFLGVSPKEGINSDKRPAYILEVTPNLRLDETQTADTLYLIANNSDKVDRTEAGATVRIRPPSKSLDAQDGSEQITFEDLETVELTYNETTDRFETTYRGFNEAGKYELFYTVRDKTTKDISPIQSSLVKNKVNSSNRSRLRSPTEFKLVSPADNTQTKTVLIFDWEDSEDFDDGPISYTLSIADDEAFENVIYQQEELIASMTYVENAENKPCRKKTNACLEDNTRYYWQIEAINEVGDGTVSDIWSFFAKDANAPPGIASIQVYNELDSTPVENVEFTFNQNPPEQMFADQGLYHFPMFSGLYQMWLTVPGYLPRRARAKADFIPLEIATGQATEINIFLEPCTDSSCAEIQPAQFSFKTNLLTLPTVKVPNVGDFAVQLQGDDAFTFTVLMDKLDQLSEATDYVAHFSFDTGQLFLPRVKVIMASGEEKRYKVTMKLVNPESLQFTLVDAVEIQ